MKISINLIFLLIPYIQFSSFAQNIFSTKYSSQADIKVYVVEYESQADLKVFKVKYSSEAKGNEGLWYFVEYESQADKKVFSLIMLLKQI
jgi:hypothetical protein